MVLPVRYQVLGPVAAAMEGDTVRLGGPKQRLVLALLLVDAGRTVTDERLVSGVWGDDAAPERARRSLQTAVSELRRALDDELVRDGGGYRLAIDPETVDAHRFEVLVEAARQRQTDAPDGAAALFNEALALWHGEPFGDLTDAPALRPEAQRLRELRLVALEGRLGADLERGRHHEVAAEVEALARDHPYREGLHGLHMLALYRSGRQADALRVYERTRSVLAEELGIDPSPELQSLHRAILTQDDELSPGPSPEGPGTAAVSTPAGFPVVPGFELRERIREGDFGTVFRAYQATVGREVAVTVLHRDLVGTASFVRDFEHRAGRVAQLDHPHVLPLLDYWRDPQGAYLVTPWMRRGTVEDALGHGAWSLPATLRMLEQVGAALVSAHRHGVVHGDLRTDNVLLDGEGNALLSGFAMAARLRDANGTPRTSQPASVSPEERRGEPLTPRSDVYGLGVLAIHTLSGERPPVDRPAAVLDGFPLPAGLLAVVDGATSLDPDQRPVQVEQFLRRLRQAAGTDVVPLPVVDEGPLPSRNPYKGLRAFQEADAADFFGRDAAVDRLVEAVRHHRLVAVVGPSGSGKSSVVRAGLVPRLRAGALPGSHDWLVTEMYPGSYPFEELEAALLRVAVERPPDLLGDLLADDHGMMRVTKQILPDGDGELLLVIDQFEELFSLTTDVELRQLFLAGLVALAGDGRGRVRTVLTMRADFFDRPLEHHAFGELVRGGLVPLAVPSRDDLALAVSRPAAAVGVEYEPGLVSEMVDDVADQPGGLPLLQHALTELFSHRDGHTITAETYRETGGVLGALGRRAEDLYRSLPEEARRVAPHVFLRLVAVDEHNEDARRRIRQAELTALEADSAAVEEVIRQFGAHRLLSFDRDPVTRGPTVEVAHEALFREWERLRGWIEDRREDLLLHRRLAVAANDWERSGHSDDYLLVGGRLDQADRWAETTQLSLTGQERAYLTASRSHRDRGESRRRRRRLAVLVALSAVAAIALALALVAEFARDRAEREERIASARALAAASRTAGRDDHDLAVLLALAAVDATRSTGEPATREAVESLHEAVTAHRVVGTIDAGGSFVELLDDGRRLFTAGRPRERPTVWDVETGEVVHTLEQHGEEPYQLAVSPDGRRAAQTYLDGHTAIWDLGTGELEHELPASQAVQVAPSFSPDGRLLAVGDAARTDGATGQTISLWDLDRGTERSRIDYPGDLRFDSSFSPDGRVLAVADWQAALVRLYDVRTGTLVDTLGDAGDPRGVSSIAFTPDGARLAGFLLTPLEVIVWDVATGDVVRNYPLGGGAQIGEVCFSGDGSVMAATAADQLVHVWDTVSGTRRLTLPASAQLTGAACDEDGTVLAKSDPSGTVRVWDITAAGPGEVLSTATVAPWTGRWSPDGDAFLATHHDGTIRRYDAATGEELARGTGLLPWPPWWFELSPDGRHVVLNADPYEGTDPAQAPVDVPLNARLVVREAGTLEVLREFDAGGWPVGFDPDGERFVAAAVNVARIVDVATGEVVRELRPPWPEGVETEMGGPGFLPDGRVLLSQGGRREAFVFDPGTGEVTGTICKAGGNHPSALSPTGDLVALATEFSTVQVWDLDRALELGAGETGCAAGAAPTDAAEIARFEANAAIGLRFSPDGTRLATAGFDGTIGVWDARTGERIMRLTHGGVVGGADFSPDGRHLLVTFNDRSSDLHAVRVYTLDVDELVTIARRKVTRDLTDAECRIHLGTPACPALSHL